MLEKKAKFLDNLMKEAATGKDAIKLTETFSNEKYKEIEKQKLEADKQVPLILSKKKRWSIQINNPTVEVMGEGE